MRHTVSAIASMCRSVLLAAFAAIAPIHLVPSAFAETFPRVSAAEGTVIARKTGEEAQFVDTARWLDVDVNQDLLAGDMLRTNAAGNLTIRFSDKTLVRMGRNTTMLVKTISGEGDSELNLKEGSIWARAARGGSRLKIETPAAAAAIRGTDWTLRVEGDRTTLTVLEGTIELGNSKGSVLVGQGEGATVTIGQAPRKYTLVNLREREQMLLYNELRGVFSGLSPSGLDGRDGRAQRRRLLAKEPEGRSNDDWLILAETALSITGRTDAREALSRLQPPLSRTEQARARLVEAMLAGQEMRYREAASLFEAARDGLPRNRQATAAYGLWFARSLAEPDKTFPQPGENAYSDDPAAALARVDAVAHIDGQAAAIEVLRAAEKRFPRDARLPAARAALALQLDRRDQVKEGLARAKALDPDNPSALVTSAQFKTAVSSDLDGALAELQHAAAVAPGADDVWNEIGIVQSDRNALVEADAAHRRAIALNPENPALRANYARFLMDNDQMAAARRQIDAAEKLDPNSYAVLAAKGRYLLRMGKTAEGEKALLDASALDPTYGDALIGLAIATYQMNATEETTQALDNADRFDPENPSIPLIRSGIALDQFEADEAIRQAREALRRRQERGGYYSGYDANRQAASFLGITLENLGLEEWGHYYGARAFDPFKSSSYFDEAAAGVSSPFVNVPATGIERFPAGSSGFSSEMQGILFDPLSVAGETKRNSLERRSFFEASLSGTVLDEGVGPGPGSDITLQGTSYAGIPVSYNIQGEFSHPQAVRENDANDFSGGQIKIGARPTLQDSVFFFANKSYAKQEFPGYLDSFEPFDALDTDSNIVGGAWSHIIADRNIFQMYGIASDTTTDEQFLGYDDADVAYRVNQNIRSRYFTFGLSHLVGADPFTFRYGIDAADMRSRSSATATATALTEGDVFDLGGGSSHSFDTRTYLDGILEISRDLKFQGGIYKVLSDGKSLDGWGPVDARVGAAWAPSDGHWLRAYFRQDTQFSTPFTLSPISTVGLQPMELPLYSSGQTQTFAARWDAEWSDRLFTAVEYQHQKFRGLSLTPDDLYTPSPTSRGRIDSVTLSANYWVGGGLGAFGSVTFNHSSDLTNAWEGEFDLPYVPDQMAQIGLKYVHPSRVTAIVAQNFVGPRIGWQSFEYKPRLALDLPGYSTTDAALTWTSKSGSLEWGVAITNIFDRDLESSNFVPSPGRTVRARLTAKF